jgi:hypothetical protein
VVRRAPNLNQRETAPKERVPGINDLNFSGLFLIWVLDQGIELIDRLIISIITC